MNMNPYGSEMLESQYILAVKKGNKDYAAKLVAELSRRKYMHKKIDGGLRDAMSAYKKEISAAAEKAAKERAEVMAKRKAANPPAPVPPPAPPAPVAPPVAPGGGSQ